MNYGQYQGQAQRNYTGIAAVALIHVVVIYALVSGLGRNVIEVLKKPLEVAILEEVKLPPPPPPPKEIKQAPPPKNAPPPPAYVPPPEVQVKAAAVEATVTATVQTPPPAPVVAAPQPAPVVEAPPKPRAVAVGIACPGYKEVMGRAPYPPQAARQGLSGDVLVEFTVGADGAISDISVIKSSNKIFNNAATSAVAQFQCAGQGQAAKATVPFVFRQEG